MDKIVQTKKISLAGEVIQTINRDNRRYIKITKATCCVELDTDTLPDIHLGDTIVIDGCIEFKTIDSCFNRKRQTTILNELCNEDPEG